MSRRISGSADHGSESPVPESANGEIASDVLLAAGRRLVEQWQADLAEAVDDMELREEVAFLVQSIRTGYVDEPPTNDAGSAVLRRRLLELLRDELVREWSTMTPPPSSNGMLQVLQACERVRGQLEPKWDQYFASRLTEPQGLELVVEVAHDLRSPLTSILFLAETLRRGQSGDINDVQRRQLGIVYSAALGLISVASDMIELARGGNQLMDSEPTPFSVAGVLESVRDIVLPMAEEKGLALRLLPPNTDQRLGYPVALSRVLLNLTTNALKFTDEGLIEVTAQEMGGGRLEFSVRDTGRGVEEEALSTLFQPFRRSRGRTGHAFSGSGLGLMISRRLVEAMNSTLRLETRSGWGTRFFFEIDLPPAEHA
jgi:signal transduction histidine kinase